MKALAMLEKATGVHDECVPMPSYTNKYVLVTQ